MKWGKKKVTGHLTSVSTVWVGRTARAMERNKHLCHHYIQEAVICALNTLPPTVFIRNLQLGAQLKLKYPNGKTLWANVFWKDNIPVTAETLPSVNFQSHSSTEDSEHFLMPLHRGTVQFPSWILHPHLLLLPQKPQMHLNVLNINLF